MSAVLEKNMPEEIFDLLLEEKIISCLIDIKIFPNIRGFKFILDGVRIILGDVSRKRNLNNKLYEDIACSYCTDRFAIDSSLRHAIDLADKRDGFKNFAKDYDYVIKGYKPTPRELLSAIAMKIKHEKRDWENE